MQSFFPPNLTQRRINSYFLSLYFVGKMRQMLKKGLVSSGLYGDTQFDTQFCSIEPISVGKIAVGQMTQNSENCAMLPTENL
jgi:hypothetical protein